MRGRGRPAPVIARPQAHGDGAPPPAAPRRRRLRSDLVLGALAVAAVALAVVLWLVMRDGTGGAAAAPKDATKTAEVSRRDLVDSTTVSGTLGYSGSRPVVYLGPGASSDGSKLASDTSAASAASATTVADRSSPAGSGPGLASAIPVAYRENDPTPTTDADAGLSATTAGTTPASPAATAPAATAPATTAPATTAPATTAPATTGPAATAPATTAPAETTPAETAPATTAPAETAPSGTRPAKTAPARTAPATTTPARTAPAAVPAKAVPASTTQATPARATEAPASAGNGSNPAGQSVDVVTWLPAEGKVVAPGHVLYRVDGKPTVLMNGSTPAYRTLAGGVPDGADVRELERNLRALGYDPHHTMTVDRHFTAQTAAAVRRWQEKLGVARTGKVGLGSVVFLPGARRVGAHSLEVGDQVQRGATIMATTSTRQVVTIDLDTSDQDLVSAGGPVRVELPDGKGVSGRISSVGKVAQTASDSSQTDAADQGDSSGAAAATIEVVVRLARRRRVDLDQAPVSVELAKEERRHVPAVPVTALVALLGGGYAVEVVDADGGTHLERVEPGLYADGYVELTGRALPEGTRVVVSQ